MTKGNHKMFLLFLGLKSWKGYPQISANLEEQNYKTKLNSIFPSFHTNAKMNEQLFLWIFCSGWELDFAEEEFYVWLYTQDEIYWSVPKKVLDFYERVASCKSQECNKHLAASFQLFMQRIFLLFNKHQEQGGNHLMSVENEICEWLFQVHQKKAKISFIWKRKTSFFIFSFKK